jgi:hypothetical protein
MNKNRFKIDGFSNPDTQSLFESWSAGQCEKFFEQERLCGFCCFGRFVGDGLWTVCLNADSAHCYETVSALFTCPTFERRADPPQGDASSSGDRST